MGADKRMRRYLVACLSAIIAVALAVVPFAGSASATNSSVPINERTFPNSVLRKAVTYHDLNKNNILDPDELQKAYDLDIVCRNDEPFSMKGIELLPSLARLSIERCKITDFSMDSIPKVTILALTDNGLADINLKGRSMSHFASNGNPIHSIDLSASKELGSLTITGSSITTFDLSDKNDLTEIDLSGNRLSQLLLPKTGRCTNLNVSNNNLSALDVTGFNNLWTLNASKNNLTEIDLTRDASLYSLNLSGNKISNIDLSQNRNLTFLNLTDNHLTEIDLYTNNELGMMSYFEGNPLLAMTPPSDGFTFTSVGGNAFEGVYYSNAFDVSTVAPIFDPSFVSNLQGATLSGKKLILPNIGTDHTVTYDYCLPKSFDMMGSSSVLHAILILQKGVEHRIMFDSNGGTPVATINTTNGKIDPPEAPSRIGYTFAGWYTAKTGGTKYDFTKLVTADMTLYAQWTVNKHTVKFDANGGTTVAAATVEHGQKVSQPANPTRTGYTFNGWYTAKAGGSKFNFDTTITADMTLYAQWTINKYTVTFDTNGGTMVNPVIAEHGKTVSKPADPTRTNYTFTGWYTAKTGGEKFDFAKPITSNVTVFAQWQPRIVFCDVNDTTPHREDIVWLADNGISTGWLMPDGTYEFRGMDTVKRQDMAAFLRRLAAKYGIAGAKDFKPVAADWKRFKDVNSKTPHAEDILWLAKSGISTGWQETDGSWTFRGMDTVKRQDMAAFLYRLADRAGKASGVTPKTDFTDVTDGTPHYKDVQWLGGSGISQGYRNANGSWRFEGMTSVYRQDMAAFLHRLNNRLAQ